MRIDARNLAKSYDGRNHAVKDLSLQIDSGQIFGLIGPNGAGKSTTLRMLATVLEPSAGQVLFDGVDPGEDPLVIRRDIGFLGDGNPLYKNMTPAEYLRFFGQCFGLHGASLEAAIDHTLQTFDLGSRRDTPASALSKGMRQRLLIARCMLHSPRLLILDEPADGLDPRGRADLRRYLQRIRSSGVTIIISSHILRELDDLCDAVAILQQGRALVTGRVDEVIEHHEVGRLTYQLRLAGPVDRAEEILRTLPVLVEDRGELDGRPALSLQLRGPEELLVEVLAALVGAGIPVLTVARERSRLEDVYARLSEHRVN